jgi:hypothetical protein
MKRMCYFAITAITILSLSCSDKKTFVPTFNGNIDGGDWVNANSVGKFGGHTGDNCSKVDSICQYSFGFYKLLSEISPDPIKKVKISVWLKLEDLSKKSTLVIALKGKDGKNVSWAGHDVNSVIKETGKWYKFEIEDVLPNYDMNGTTIEIYIFNPNKGVTYVDDWEMRFLGE